MIDMLPQDLESYDDSGLDPTPEESPVSPGSDTSPSGQSAASKKRNKKKRRSKR